MLPGDTYREEKDPALCDFPPGLANALQRDVSVLAASEVSPAARFPAGPPTWGGGKILVFGTDAASFDDGDTITIDDSMDWRNRLVVVLACKFYDAANKVPGGGSEPEDQMVAAKRVDILLSFYTGAGVTMDDDPPSGGPFLSLFSGATWGYLFVRNGVHDLRMRNDSGATAYPWLVLFVTDQFPTRT